MIQFNGVSYGSILNVELWHPLFLMTSYLDQVEFLDWRELTKSWVSHSLLLFHSFVLLSGNASLKLDVF